MEAGMNWTALRDEYRRQVFQVFNGDGWMRAYGHVQITQPGLPSPTRDLTLQDVIDELVDDVNDRIGTDHGDMAVWRNGCILAVVRKIPKGRPEVTRFVPQVQATAIPEVLQ